MNQDIINSKLASKMSYIARKKPGTFNEFDQDFQNSRQQRSSVSKPEPAFSYQIDDDEPVRQQVFKVRKQFNQNEKYAVMFSIQYECKLGQTMGVCGSTPELGEWKQCNAIMKWTEGNIWKLTTPLHVSKRYFKYKYVIVEGGKMVQWEKGIDRLADLAICQEINIDGSQKSSNFEKSPIYKQSMKQSMGINDQVKLVSIHDNWE